MKTALGRFLDNREGVIGVLIAIAMPVLLGTTALAVEAGLWYAERRSLQTAADAGAMGAALELANNRSYNVTSAATDSAARNGWSAASSSIEVNNPPLSGADAGDTNAVEVILRQTMPLLLTQMFLSEPVVIRTRAVARITPGTGFCVLALDPGAGGALTVGGTGDVLLTECGVASNSVASNAMAISGTGKMNTESVHTVGGVSVSGSGTLTTAQDPQTYAPAIPDPYAGLAAPTVGACDETNWKSGAHANVTIYPGVYCGGLDVGQQANVTLAPGTYIIDGGGLNVNGNAALQGSGVTIIMTSSSGSDYGTVDINGGAVVDLSAPSSGTYAGILFFQDRDAPTTGSHSFLGGSTTEFKGALYFPKTKTIFSGGNSSDGGCMQIVARTVEFRGNSDIDADCTGVGVKDMGPPRTALVE